MKRNNKKVVFGLIMSAFLALPIAIKLANNKEIRETKAYTFGDALTYYQSIGDNETETTLLSSLRALNSNKRKTTVGYNSMGTVPSGDFKYTDYDPSTVTTDSNGAKYGTKIIGYYTTKSLTSFNREHVWPDSHGGNLVENDIHMTRPADPSDNGSRGNSFFVEGMNSTSNGWDPANFNCEEYRGDAARIIFYCVIANSNLSLIDSDYHSTSKSNRDNLMGKLSDLLKWNLQYSVSDREKRRNEGAEYLQGNRNPFIDHPEYACRIWGNTNSTTKSICASNITPETPTNYLVIVDSNNNDIGDVQSLKVGETLFVKSLYTTSEVVSTWSSYDHNVATVSSNGLITAVSEGSTTIKASYTRSGTTYTDTFTLIVNPNESDSGTSTDDNPSGTQTGDRENKGIYTLVEDTTDLVNGATYVIASPNQSKVAGPSSTTFLLPLDCTLTTDKKTLTAEETLEFTLEKSGSNYKFLSDEGYLGCSAEKKVNLDNNGITTWNIAYNSTTKYYAINSTNSDYGTLQYNSSSPRFTTYKSGQQVATLYKKYVVDEVPVTGITLNATNKELIVGDTFNLVATISPDNATNKEYTWSSSAPTIASVSTSGIVTALKEGTTTIKATSSDKNISASCTITVKNKTKLDIPTGEYSIVLSKANSKLSSSASSNDTIVEYEVTGSDTYKTFAVNYMAGNIVSSSYDEIGLASLKTIKSNNTSNALIKSITIEGYANYNNGDMHGDDSSIINPSSEEYNSDTKVNTLVYDMNYSTNFKLTSNSSSYTWWLYSITIDLIVIPDGAKQARKWASSFYTYGDTTTIYSSCLALNVSESTWSNYASTYANLSDDAKNYFFNNAANPLEIEIYQAAQVYEYIIYKYNNLEEFISDANGEKMNLVRSKNSNNIFTDKNNENLALLVILIGVISITILAFVIKTKHKQ